jgi:hypothetical protein
LLATLNFFFKQCQEYGFKLHARKCVLFATTVSYCGRSITKDGRRFDPKNMKALQTMREPQNGADLVQYVAAVNWMRSAIPNYSKRVAPLQAALALVSERKRCRTKKGAAAVSLLQLWGPEEQAAFKNLQAANMESIKLAFPDPDKRICVLTDASDRFYASLVTQTAQEQQVFPIDERAHQPLAFLFGEFKCAQLRWTVPEKECRAIVDTGTKVDDLLLSHDEFSILSDHLNLTYTYNPLSADPTLARHVVHRLQRRALKMSVLSYRMEHVMGELNYWTDIMTRWGAGWIAGSEHKAHGKMASMFLQPYISPPDTIRSSFRPRMRFYWRSRALSMSTIPEKQRDGSSRITAAESRCWWYKDDKQCTLDSRACSFSALLRMRPLSISCAESCVAISCGNVDFDKSG